METQEDLWQSWLGGDQNIVGKTVNLSRRAFLVVGVAPPDLKHVGDTLVAHGGAVDFWLPMRLQPGRLSRTWRNFEVVGRLKQGVIPEEARTDLNRIAAALERDYPANYTNWRAAVRPLKERIVGKAEPYFSNESPIGRNLQFGRGTAQIVGVVGDVKDSPASLSVEPTVFRSHLQRPVARVTVAVKTRGEASAGTAPIRAAIDRLDPNVPLFAVKSLKSVADDAIATQRFAVFLFASFAGVALVLATVGAYGVMSFLTNLRGKEFAIRAALGATPVAIMQAVLRRALGIAAVGAMAGLLGSWGLARLLESYLYGVPPGDWVARGLAVIVLMTATLLAALVPARRGARVDPASMLKAE